jgi:hypothetical protein
LHFQVYVKFTFRLTDGSDAKLKVHRRCICQPEPVELDLAQFKKAKEASAVRPQLRLRRQAGKKSNVH